MGPICSPKLYANRNIAAAGWLNALMGGLPDHGAHHALPWITASRLPQATARIAWVLASHQLPGLPQAGSYWAGLRQTAAGSAMPLPLLSTNAGAMTWGEARSAGRESTPRGSRPKCCGTVMAISRSRNSLEVNSTRSALPEAGQPKNVQFPAASLWTSR